MVKVGDGSTKGRGAVLAKVTPLVLLLLLGQALFTVLPVPVLGGSTDPIYMSTDDVSLKAYPTGSYIVEPVEFPSRWVDTASSFWTFKVDTVVRSTYEILLIDNVVTPIRKMGDGSIKLQLMLQDEVLFDLTYRAAGPSVEVTATVINLGGSEHTIGMRYLYDIRGKLPAPPGENPSAFEMSYAAPTFEKVNVYDKEARVGLAALGASLGADQPDKVVFGHWDNTRYATYDYNANTSKEVGQDATMLLYWNDMKLSAYRSITVRHFFGKGDPVPPASNQDLVMEALTVDPPKAFVGKTRTVMATVRNIGPVTEHVELDLIVTDPHGQYINNGTLAADVGSGQVKDLVWTYKVRKEGESRVVAIADPSRDNTPYDNAKVQFIETEPFPYKVHLEFENEKRVEYVFVDSGEKAKVKIMVENRGTVEDRVRLTTSSLPDKWSSSFNRSEVVLTPGATTDVELTVKTSKDNRYYNYGIDIVGRSVEGEIEDKVFLLVSLKDVIAAAGGNVSIGGNITPVSPDPNPNPNPPTPDPTPNDGDTFKIDKTQLAMFLVGGICIFLAIILIHQIFVMGSKMSMEGILKDLYKKLYDTRTSDAYRKAIFKAYKQMCAEMARYGHTREEHITPKEFEREIRKYLPIDKKHLHTLTKLFEEARYSTHAFNERKKRKALAALKGIIDSLENVTTFEEVKGRRWFRKNT